MPSMIYPPPSPSLGVAQTKAYATCIHFTLHLCVNMCVCVPAIAQSECDCVCLHLQCRLCSWYYKCECLCVKQWTAARPHYCHSPHCLKERQREAKRLLSIEELRKDGDKRPKLNKCWKAAWRASPWSYDLNERERLQGYPIWVFQRVDHTDTLHPSIQLNRSTHTGVPVHVHVLCPSGMSFWCVHL